MNINKYNLLHFEAYWYVINQFQVQVRSATEKLRTRIVKEKGLYAVLVGIVKGQRSSVTAKRFCNVPQMQEQIVNNIFETYKCRVYEHLS